MRVIPRAHRSVVEGIRDGRLLVRVTAPPVDRAANNAVIALLAKTLAVPRSAIRVVTGEAARNKTVEISGVACDVAAARLGQPFQL